jgi:hypothetical protein
MSSLKLKLAGVGQSAANTHRAALRRSNLEAEEAEDPMPRVSLWRRSACASVSAGGQTSAAPSAPTD